MKTSSKSFSPFVSQYQVVYADTDAGGVMYHAKFLEAFERQRMDFLRQNEFPLAWFQNRSRHLAIRSVSLEFLKPVRLGEGLQLTFDVVKVGSASFVAKQFASVDGTICVEAEFLICCVNPAIRPVSLPGELKTCLHGG